MPTQRAANIAGQQDMPDPAAVIAIALAAPKPPPPTRDTLLEQLAALVRAASDADADVRDHPRVVSALESLAAISASDGLPSLTAAANARYADLAGLAEDLYLLRAAVERPQEAAEVLDMQAVLATLLVPPGEPDLQMDRTIAEEQLRFAGLVPEPQRLPTARAAFRFFRERYVRRYVAHHQAYWEAMERLRLRLMDGRGPVRALLLLNSLTELGTPVGEGALEAYEELLREADGCPLQDPLPEAMAEAAECPSCHLKLDQAPPTEMGAELLGRIQRSTERQMSRLSSIGVRQLLERSLDPRVERFLKVVQMSQLSSLAEILDDELVGYLRRFLVEARIDTALEPVMQRIQEGRMPYGDEARESLQEVAETLQRALRGLERVLPERAGEPQTGLAPGKPYPRKRKGRQA